MMFELETRRVIMCTRNGKDAMDLALENQLIQFNHVDNISELEIQFHDGRINKDNTVIWQTPIGRTHEKYVRLSILAETYDIPVIQKDPREVHANLMVSSERAQ